MKGTWPIFKTEILIYQLKVNLDVKIMFGEITHLFGPGLGKMLVRALYGNEKSNVRFWSMTYLPLKFTMRFGNRI